MAQTRTIGKTATTISNSVTGDTVITYHKTAVVKFNGHVIRLNSDGWRTVTTKTRMNQASNQYGLGFYVRQSKGIWYVGFYGHEYLYHDHILLDRDTNGVYLDGMKQKAID